MNLKNRVEGLLSNKSLGDDNKLRRLYFKYRKEMGLTHEEMMKEPIPTVMLNLKFLEEEAKKFGKKKKVK